MSDALARAWRAAVAACAPAAVVARAVADEPALARGAVTVVAMGKAAARWRRARWRRWGRGRRGWW
ncbi:MAG: hypothetical protein HS111_27670 [Kofleriaceae bacterium]|nr:hypothetical protein [Kofleriaceae bacterium]